MATRHAPLNQVNRVVAATEQTSIPVMPVDGKMASDTPINTTPSIKKMYFKVLISLKQMMRELWQHCCADITSQTAKSTLSSGGHENFPWNQTVTNGPLHAAKRTAHRPAKILVVMNSAR